VFLDVTSFCLDRSPKEIMDHVTNTLVEFVDHRVITFGDIKCPYCRGLRLFKHSRTQTWRSRPEGLVPVTSQGVSETHRSGQVSGQGFQKNEGQVRSRSHRSSRDLRPYLWPLGSVSFPFWFFLFKDTWTGKKKSGDGLWKCEKCDIGLWGAQGGTWKLKGVWIYRLYTVNIR
jgi:hypothetical protein